MSYQGPESQITVDYRRLWAGGAATAAVAALVAAVGLLIARGLFDVAVLAPKGDGIWGDADTLTYALIAAAAALGATGLALLLGVTTPTPGRFFGWIMALVTLIAIVLPLTLSVTLEAKVATALINLAIGLTITVLVGSTAASARRPQVPSGPAADTAGPWRPRSDYPR
jgi:hypothetical protein